MLIYPDLYEVIVVVMLILNLSLNTIIIIKIIKKMAPLNFNKYQNFESSNDYHHLFNIETEHQKQKNHDLNSTTNTTHSHDQLSAKTIPNIPFITPNPTPPKNIPNIIGNVGNGRGVKETEGIATEKLRRQRLKDKVYALNNLLPNPTKADQPSVLGGAIEYINELKRTIEELTIVVEKKRCNTEMKKNKTEDDPTLDVETISTTQNGSSHRS